MKQSLYLLVTALGAVIFAIMSFYIVKLPTDVITHENAAIIQNILSSICASFFFLLSLDTGYYVRDAFVRKSFRKFFGELSISTTSNLVYPDFVLSEQSRERLKDMPHTEIFRKRADQYPGTRFIEVPKIVASNDLQAIVIIATKMGIYLGDSPRLITDGQAVTDPSRSFISFGLSSNAVTDLYQGADPAALFKLENVADDPKIVVQVNGKAVHYGRDNEVQHGIILRYRPNPEDYPTKYWFICAGLAAAGTPAAAWKLAHDWRKYHRRFGQKDFLIVFKTSNDTNNYVTAAEVCAISK